MILNPQKSLDHSQNLTASSFGNVQPLHKIGNKRHDPYTIFFSNPGDKNRPTQIHKPLHCFAMAEIMTSNKISWRKQ